jgi:Zn-dependent protease with chaperone function
MVDGSDEGRRRNADENPTGKRDRADSARQQSRRLQPVDDPPVPERVAVPSRRLNVVKTSEAPTAQASKELPPEWLPKRATATGERPAVAKEREVATAPSPQPAPRKQRALAIAVAGGAFALTLIGASVYLATTGSHDRLTAYRSTHFSQAELAVMGSAWRNHGAAAWGGVHSNAEVAEHVARIGQSAVAALGARAAHHAITFVVVDAPKVAHAFALVDDTVVVTSGLLGRLHSDAELFAVLAHAGAHIARGDAQRALDEHLDRAGDANVGQARAAVEAPAADPDTLVALAGLAGTVAAAHDAELDVDAAVTAALTSAGYDPTALRRVVVIRLGGRVAWLDQHPVSAERKAALNSAVGEGREDSESYHRHVRGKLSARPRAPDAPPAEAAVKKGLSVEEVEAMNRPPPPDPRGTWVSPDIKPPEPQRKASQRSKPKPQPKTGGR